MTGPFSLLRFCGGLILDIKRKAPFFISDFTDALHIQALSAILFIYLGTVTNAITFGGLLGDATENMQVRRRFESLENVQSACLIIKILISALDSSLTAAGSVGEFSGDCDHRWDFLSAGRPASHHPQQYWSCFGV